MIPYGRQSINDDDIAAVVSALKGDFLTTGPLVELFEQKLEDQVGVPCVAVSSGTAALHCAYAAIDLQPGDEVITPPITFIATQATAALFGAKIVFADVQLDTGNIDPVAVEAAVTPKTKAIVAVDYAGHPAELDELRTIAGKHGIYLIEDAAHSLGSTYKGRPVGSVADITTFSFFPTKNITTGEGGAIASKHPNLLIKAKRFARQGLVKDSFEFKIKDQGPWHQEVHEFGLNYRLPDVMCALGITQLARLENFKTTRESIFEIYMNELSQETTLVLPSRRAYVSPMWHLFHLHVEKEIRGKVFKFMRDNGIFVQVNYLPAYRHPVFVKYGYRVGEFPRSDQFYNSEISIPIHTELTESQIHYVIENLRKAL